MSVRPVALEGRSQLLAVPGRYFDNTAHYLVSSATRISLLLPSFHWLCLSLRRSPPYTSRPAFPSTHSAEPLSSASCANCALTEFPHHVLFDVLPPAANMHQLFDSWRSHSSVDLIVVDHSLESMFLCKSHSLDIDHCPCL